MFPYKSRTQKRLRLKLCTVEIVTVAFCIVCGTGKILFSEVTYSIIAHSCLLSLGFNQCPYAIDSEIVHNPELSLLNMSISRKFQSIRKMSSSEWRSIVSIPVL